MKKKEAKLIESEIKSLHKHKEQIEEQIIKKEKFLSEALIGKDVLLSKKYIKWVRKNVLVNPNWFGSSKDCQKRKRIYEEVCDKNLTGKIIRISHRGCYEDELVLHVQFSNGHITNINLADLIFK